MKELVILSGKGGTGKTTLVASFAVLANDKIMVDCDVDAADLHLILHPEVKEKHEFYGGKSASINPERCIACGKCQEVCRFNAISDQFEVNKLLCEGCGACKYFCPTQAVQMEDDLSGHWYISNTEYGPFIHASLGIAEENSGKLVTLIRSKARIIAEEKNANLIINDGSPGIGCPVIASITGADLVLVVVEPTLSGIHDLKRVVELTNHFNIASAVCINKADINPDMVKNIKNYCQEEKIKLLGELSYDEQVIKAQVLGKPIVNHKNSKITKEIVNLWDNTVHLLVN